MLAHILALALATYRGPDTWVLKPSFDPKTKLAWGVTVEAQLDGEAHHATFELTRTVKSSDGKKTIATYSWDHLAIDDQEGQEVPPWDVFVGKRGEILKTDNYLDDNYRRMLSALIFVYPDKPVAIGDKWTRQVMPTGPGVKITYSYEAKKTEIVNDVSTIIISAKLTEDGKDRMTGEGFWWVSRVGRVLKFEMKMKNWIVPMAGTDPIEGILRGQAL